jgi:aspartate 1-decarboxylase
MKNILIFLFICFGFALNSQITITCYECKKNTTVDCKGCNIQSNLFTGIVIKEKGKPDIPLYEPYKVSNKSSVFTFEDAFGTKTIVNVTSVLSYNTPKKLYDYLSNCLCKPSTIDTDTDRYSVLIQDSILVTYDINGVEIDRDTIRLFDIDTDTKTFLVQDSILVYYDIQNNEIGRDTIKIPFVDTDIQTYLTQDSILVYYDESNTEIDRDTIDIPNITEQGNFRISNDTLYHNNSIDGIEQFVKLPSIDTTTQSYLPILSGLDTIGYENITYLGGVEVDRDTIDIPNITEQGDFRISNDTLYHNNSIDGIEQFVKLPSIDTTTQSYLPILSGLDTIGYENITYLGGVEVDRDTIDIPNITEQGDFRISNDTLYHNNSIDGIEQFVKLPTIDTTTQSYLPILSGLDTIGYENITYLGGVEVDRDTIDIPNITEQGDFRISNDTLYHNNSIDGIEQFVKLPTLDTTTQSYLPILSGLDTIGYENIMYLGGVEVDRDTITLPLHKNQVQSNETQAVPYTGVELPITSGVNVGDTKTVQFSDGTVVNYTWNGTTWVLDFNTPTYKLQSCDGLDLVKDTKVYQVTNLTQKTGYGVVKLDDVGCFGHNDEYYDSSLYSYAGSKIQNNTATGVKSLVINGFSNNASGLESTIINGYINSATGARSWVSNGITNNVNGDKSWIGNGQSNLINSSDSWIGNGSFNIINGNRSFILNGYTNIISSNNSFINSGYYNNIENSDKSQILNGEYNYINSNLSIIGNGTDNNISSVYTNNTILNGSSNVISNASSSLILGGINNKILALPGSIPSYSIIGSGANNTLQGDVGYSAILGGNNNFINQVWDSYIFGGINNTLELGSSYGIFSFGENLASPNYNPSSYNSARFIIGNGTHQRIDGLGAYNYKHNSFTHNKNGYTQINTTFNHSNNTPINQLQPISSLDVVSTISGVTIPRLTDTEVVAWQAAFNTTSDVTGIGGSGNEKNSRQGEMVYNLTTSMYVSARWNGSTWNFVTF